MFVQHACQMLSASVLPGLWLHIDALFLVFPILYLRFAHGLPQLVIVSLAYDAMWPGPYGTRLVIYSLILAVMVPIRLRIRRENPMHVLLLSMALNLVVFVGLALVATFSPEHMGEVPIGRMLGDLLASELVVGLCAFWWLEVQRALIIMSSGDDPAGYPIVG